MRVAPQAPRMVNSALDTRTIPPTDRSAPGNCPPTIPPDSSFQPLVTLPGKCASANAPYDIGSFDLVRNFVELVIAKNASTLLGSGRSLRSGVDWKAVEAAVADSPSFEQAIGRAIVITDQMCRGVFDSAQLDDAPSSQDDAPSSLKTDDPFFAFSMADVDADFGDECRYRTLVAKRLGRIFGSRRKVVALAVSFVLVLFSVTIYQLMHQGPSESASYRAPDVSGNAQLLNNASPAVAVSLPVATAPPALAPPTLADAPPLRPHEVFGFAPYWTLDQSAAFNVNEMSTIAYFSIDVNPDGTLNQSGPGWDGYQSQALSSLISRAHGAGDRVVLTVTCFDQAALDRLTSSTSAPSTLATALIGAVQAKNLDGVNLDFEGSGSADQAGVTRLVTQVSTAIHGVNPHYQVTMDTYASSAGDPGGFYNILRPGPSRRRLLRHGIRTEPPVRGFRRVATHQHHVQRPNRRRPVRGSCAGF